MTIGRIEAADDHLRRMIGTKPVLGLAELVWNAVDANATEVAVTVKRTVADAVDEVIVRDNGHGFGANEIVELFGAVGGSWKHRAPNRKTRGGSRILHGDKGEGRWKAFSIGDRVVWESVTAREDGQPNQKVRLVMSEQRLDEYDWTGPTATDEAVGTTVTVRAGIKEPNVLLTEKGRHDLTTVMALYLTKYPDVTVTYDGTPLAVTDLITDKVEIEVPYDNEYGPVTLTVIEWEGNVDRALYLCDESGATLHEANAGIHAPGSRSLPTCGGPGSERTNRSCLSPKWTTKRSARSWTPHARCSERTSVPSASRIRRRSFNSGATKTSTHSPAIPLTTLRWPSKHFSTSSLSAPLTQ